MAVVMIRCAATGRAISTGIETDRESFNTTPLFYSRTLCPHCLVEHQWFAKDAWIEGAQAEIETI
jgi:uncharacterized protein (DUF2225 family)